MLKGRAVFQQERDSFFHELCMEQGPEEAREQIRYVMCVFYLVCPADHFESAEEQEGLRESSAFLLASRIRPRIGPKACYKWNLEAMGTSLQHLLMSRVFERAAEVAGNNRGTTWILVGLLSETYRRFWRGWDQRIGDDVRGPGWRQKELQWPEEGTGLLREFDSDEDPEGTLIEEIALAASKQEVRELTAEILTPRQDEVLWLHLEGSMHREIANLLGISMQHSMDVKARAMKKLRESPAFAELGSKWRSGPDPGS